MIDVMAAKWRSADEVMTIAFGQSRIVMISEAHDGLRRVIQHREQGVRAIPTAHQAGVRYLAVEAIPWDIAASANQHRTIPKDAAGTIAQEDMQQLVIAALNLGWTLIPYDANPKEWLLEHAQGKINPDDTLTANQYLLSHFQESYNWRERQQAHHLHEAIGKLPTHSRIMVWCGMGHNQLITSGSLQPMAYQFSRLCSLRPFTIDQAANVFGQQKGNPVLSMVLKLTNRTITQRGGVAGFLGKEAPLLWKPVANTFDAFILTANATLI